MCCRVIHHGNVCICNFHFHDSLTCIFLFSLDLEENPKIMGYMIYHTFPGSSYLSSVLFLLMIISSIYLYNILNKGVN